jgi:hypothetical protein
MRLLTLQIIAVGLFAGAAGAGPTQDEARKILAKAIEAQGGEEALNKYQAGTIKTKGHIEVLGGFDFTQEINFQLPNKVREELSFEINGQAIRTVVAYDGKKGAIEVNGKKIPDNDKITESLRDGVQLLEVGKLVPLKGKAYELMTVGEAQVNGKPAVGIRASKKGQRDVTLYFDKETHLLAKLEQRTVDAQSGQEVDQERIFTEYQKVNGVPMPKRVIVNRDGKKFLEAEVTDFQQFEKLDDGMFTLP